MPVRELLAEAERALAVAGVDEPRLVAEVLLAHVLERPRVWLYAHHDDLLAAEPIGLFRTLLTRAVAHEPLAYLTGEREFFGRTFFVRPGVLVPRPETECLVEIALTRLGTARPVVADVGCGSGIIGVTVALERPAVRVLAIELDARASRLARCNAERFGARNLLVVRGDLLTAVRVPLDAVLANLPYVTDEQMGALPRVVRAEPRRALAGGTDGLDLYRRLLPQAQALLAPGGFCALEIGAEQGDAARALARRVWPSARVTVERDYAGLDRVLVIEPDRDQVVGNPPSAWCRRDDHQAVGP